MRKIYFGIIFSIPSLFVYLFVIGVFHPKEIYLDDLEIKAPKNMILSDVNIDYINTQNILSPLFLSNNNKYRLSNSEYISIGFRTVGLFPKIRGIRISIFTKDKKETFIEKFQSKKGYDELKNNVCLVYISKNDLIYSVDAFSKQENIHISILSYSKEETIKMMKQFCVVTME